MSSWRRRDGRSSFQYSRSKVLVTVILLGVLLFHAWWTARQTITTILDSWRSIGYNSAVHQTATIDYVIALSNDTTTITNDNKNEIEYHLTEKTKPISSTSMEDWSSVDFVAMFGAGHRLNRLSLANFIALHLGFGVRTFWGFCNHSSTIITTENNTTTTETIHRVVEKEVFSHLFGTQPLLLQPSVNNGGNNTSIHQNIYLVNKIVTGFEYLHRRIKRVNTTTSIPSPPPCTCHSLPIQAKINADNDFYRSLRDRFRAKQRRVQPMLQEYFQKSCFVIGLHIRAGNGEGQDFAGKHRAIFNETVWLSRLAHHIQTLVQQWGHGNNATRCRQQGHPLYSAENHNNSTILFVATDTISMVQHLEILLHNNGTQQQEIPRIQVVVLDQERKMDGTGVWFGGESLHERGDKCLMGWEDTFTDMILLSHADLVLASRLSTFTQTIPMSLVYAARQEKLARLQHSFSNNTTTHHHDHHHDDQLPPAYCELDREAVNMQCFDTFMDWCCHGTSTWGPDSIELPLDNFFTYPYFNATPRPADPNECNPKNKTSRCLPLMYYKT